MYESKNEALLSKTAFMRRLAVHVFAAIGLIIVVMLLGITGHIVFEEISLHDAVLNTASVLGGVGLFTVPNTAFGKVFISLYGFVTELFFMASIGVILAPVAHRIIHKFHLDSDD